MKIEFDLLKQEYIEQICEIEKVCFAEPWSPGMFRQELDNPLAIYFIALCDGEVVGYIGCWQIINEGHITNVAVKPDFRRLGIAKELISRLIQMLRDNDFIYLTLEVRRSNTSAIQLYESFGFAQTGVRKKYYQDNEDALLMATEL